MVSLNNMLPLVGALIPALYQSRSTTTNKLIEEYPLLKFTNYFMGSLFVVMFSCLTIHINILNSNIIWVGRLFNISMTTLHYIFVFGFGLVLLSNYIFGLLVDNIKNRLKRFPFICINIFNLLITTHILFINYLLPIRS